MLVQEIMTADPITIDKGAKVNEAVKLLSINQIGRLIVMNEQQVAGIVTDGDLMVEHDFEEKIDEFMSENIIGINQEQTIIEAAKLLAKHEISGLPVFDSEQNLVGIITVEDIVYRYLACK